MVMCQRARLVEVGRRFLARPKSKTLDKTALSRIESRQPYAPVTSRQPRLFKTCHQDEIPSNLNSYRGPDTNTDTRSRNQKALPTTSSFDLTLRDFKSTWFKLFLRSTTPLFVQSLFRHSSNSSSHLNRASAFTQFVQSLSSSLFVLLFVTVVKCSFSFSLFSFVSLFWLPLFRSLFLVIRVDRPAKTRRNRSNSGTYCAAPRLIEGYVCPG